MKRIFCFLFVLVLVFSVSCGKEDTNSNNSPNLSEHHSMPKIIIISLNEMKDIKNALNSMGSDEFFCYMQENYENIALNGMFDSESTRRLLEEMESTTVALLEGNERDLMEFVFYWERNEVHQLIFFDESSRVSAYNYTPQSGRNQSDAFGEMNKKAVLLKELNCNGVSVSVYKTDDEETFFADVFADNTYIYLRTKDIETIEDVETCFSKLKFVKIGDLLNESYTEESQIASCSETTLSFEEAVTDLTEQNETKVEKSE